MSAAITMKYFSSLDLKVLYLPSDLVPSISQYQGKKHKAEVSHELLGGAAAFAAAHEYEEYKARNGEPDSHARAKEIM